MYDPWRQVYSECLKNFMNRKELIMQSYTNFEKSLAQDARLFSLSKTDMDLFSAYNMLQQYAERMV